MKIYVAAKWEDRPRVQQIYQVLRELGHTITYDWTACDQFSIDQAIHDRQGVMDAEGFVFIAEKDYPFKGAYVEFGMACARNIPCYILGTPDGTTIDKCIFVQLPNVQVFTSIERLLAALPQVVLP